MTWNDAPIPEAHSAIGAAGYARAILRGVPLILLVFGGLALLLLVRLVEAPLFRPRRPWTPHITQFVCRGALWLLGIGYHVAGTPLRGPGAIVANHSSWLDIFTLNAAMRLYFVSKAEVAAWPGIGWLARATGTVFIARKRQDAKAHIVTFRTRLRVGHRLMFFPEGTSTDGLRVLPFKPTLFAAFFDPELPDDLALQAVTLRYVPPAGEDPKFYGWWGDMDFGPHLLSTLAARRHGAVHVTFHRPVSIADFDNRKTLARTLEDQVRGAIPAINAPSADAGSS